MKALVNTGPGRLELQDWPQPEPGPGQVRIRTRACAVCATDLEMIQGWERTGFPAIPGHEWCGRVDAVGPGVDPALCGQFCVGENVLRDGGEVGFEHPGGYGEFFLTEPDKLHPLPPDLSSAAATLIEPLAVALRGLDRLRLSGPETALVFGDGPLGLILVLLLARAGLTDALLVGGRACRLALARELCGVRTLNHHEAGPDLGQAVRRLGRNAYPLVLEASGAAAALEAGIELAANGAQILVIGAYGDARARFRWNHLLWRELELIGSNASAGAWSAAVQIAAAGDLPLARLISHRFPVAEFADAFELVQRAGGACVKVVLEW